MRGSKTMDYECDDSLTPALGGRGGVRARKGCQEPFSSAYFRLKNETAKKFLTPLFTVQRRQAISELENVKAGGVNQSLILFRRAKP